MKTTWNASSLVSVLLAGITAPTYAAKESMTVTQDDITFTVNRYDDGRSKPYEVEFDQDDVSSKYKFDTDGFVTRINIGTERYRVVYKTNGDFRKVRRTDSDARRMLRIEDTEAVHEKDGTLGHRRLYDCDDCEEAWDAACDEGVPSVCSIAGYGSPLTDATTASMETFCESFGGACSLSGGGEACADQCESECVRSLAISLEWYSDADLDLYVTEPSGVVVYWANRDGDAGFLDNDNQDGPDSEPENYLLYSDLSVDTDNVLGDYTAVVKRWNGDGPIPWKLTATSNREELWVEEGEFSGVSGEASGIFTATVSEYLDYGCTNVAASGDVQISGASEKYQTTP